MTSPAIATQYRFARCWVDGGVLGHNPSPRGIYWSARIELGGDLRPVTLRRRLTVSIYKTNNDAEWFALREALQWLAEHNVQQPVLIHSDSRLIVQQFNGRWNCEVERHQKLRDECREYAKRLKWVAVTWRSRVVMVRKLGH